MANSYFNYQDPVNPGDRIESTKYNSDFAGISRAFDTLPSPDALASNVGNVAITTGTGAAYLVSLPRFDGSFGYLVGMQVLAQIHINNTGPATINVNGIGAKPLVNLTTGNGALVAGDLKQGAFYDLRYDGTNFQVTNTVATAITATAAASQLAATSATNAQTYANQASASQTAAASSASSASTSASQATTAATNAANSATAAAGSATTATNSANAAAGSATTATNQATAAAGSATAAGNSATAANTSATNANNSKTAAATSATNAANSATAAAGSATTATNALTDAAFVNAVMNVQKTTTARLNIVKFFAANVDPNTIWPGTTWVKLPASQNIRTCLADASDIMTTGGSDTVALSVPNMPSHNHNASVTINNTDLGTKTASTFDYGTKTASTVAAVNVTTSSFDYGTKTTSAYDFASITSSAAGAHTHTMQLSDAENFGTFGGEGSQDDPQKGTLTTSASGAHSHTIDLPSHNHTVGIGAHTHTFNVGAHTHTVAIGSHNHTVAMGAHNHTATATVLANGSGTAFSVVNANVKLIGWRRTA